MGLTDVIQMIKAYKDDLTNDVSYKATEQVREVKADYEKLEVRLKEAGSVEDNESYDVNMDRLNRRSSLLGEKARRLNNAKDFGADLIEDMIEIENLIEKDHDETTKKKEQIEALKVTLEVRKTTIKDKVEAINQKEISLKTKLNDLQVTMKTKFDAKDIVQPLFDEVDRNKKHLFNLQTDVDLIQQKLFDIASSDRHENLNEKLSTL